MLGLWLTVGGYRSLAGPRTCTRCALSSLHRGGVSLVEEAELAEAVDAGTVPYDAVLCGVRLLTFGKFLV